MKTIITIGDDHVHLAPNGDVEVVMAARQSISRGIPDLKAAPVDTVKVTIPKAKRFEVAALLLGVDADELKRELNSCAFTIG